MPEIKLPEVHLPGGLREMRREDVQQAVGDVRVPHIELPKTIELPKNIRLPEIDLSKVELPAAIEERMPGRRRRNPLMPLLVVGASLAAAAWLVLASPIAPTIRRAVDDLRTRLGGRRRSEIHDTDDLDPGVTTVGVAAFETTAYEPSRDPVAMGPGEAPATSDTATVDPVGADAAYAEGSTYAAGTPGELPEWPDQRDQAVTEPEA